MDAGSEKLGAALARSWDFDIRNLLNQTRKLQKLNLTQLLKVFSQKIRNIN
jgi:hypothetical protein